MGKCSDAFPQKRVPACIVCHGPIGEGSDIEPRLAGQNVLYMKSQFTAFANLSCVVYCNTNNYSMENENGRHQYSLE